MFRYKMRMNVRQGATVAIVLLEQLAGVQRRAYCIAMGADVPKAKLLMVGRLFTQKA